MMANQSQRNHVPRAIRTVVLRENRGFEVRPLHRRPSWQQDDCPPWCVVAHAEDDHPHDRKHVSVELPVPVSALTDRVPPDAPERDRWTATEFVVCLQRRDGSAQTWVYVGDGFEQRIEVGVGDMERILAAFAQLMEGVPR